jgi:histidinol-phosphate/aromatic aminotransferase/cobyric acid decarboxylase-like protein
MIGFVRTLIFLIGSYYLIRFVMRLFAPDKRRAVTPPPSHTTVNYSAKKSGGSRHDNDGEYIDYEEVK